MERSFFISTLLNKVVLISNVWAGISLILGKAIVCHENGIRIVMVSDITRSVIAHGSGMQFVNMNCKLTICDQTMASVVDS